MKAYNHPYDIDHIVLNVKVDFIARGLIDRQGAILDLQAFKTALVSSIKKPIIIGPNDNMQAKLDQGHDILTQIIVYITMNSNGPVHAGFRKSTITLKASETIAEYVIQSNESGGDVHILGEKKLTPEQQKDIFTSLGKDLVRAQIFDSEPPAVAAALRDLLERR